MTRTWTGAHGAMSWKTRMSSSSYAFLLGISPATMRQKMQLGSRAMTAPFSGRHRRVRRQVEPAADDAVEKPDRDDPPRDPARHVEQQEERKGDEVEPAGPEDAADPPGEMRLLPGAARVLALDHVDQERDQQQQHARLHAGQHRADRDDRVQEVADVADRLQRLLAWIRDIDDVVHVPSASLRFNLRAANSSSPDWRSRRSSSARTSRGARPCVASAIMVWNQRSATSATIFSGAPSLHAMTTSVASS